MSGLVRRPVVVALALLGSLVGGAAADVPQGTPAFSAPLDVTNAYLPFVPGAVKVYGGREGNAAVTLVESHRTETREFEWQGGTVACRVVEHLKFVRGAPESLERSYVAQADDGSVWSFGEVEDTDPTDDGGDDAGEPGGWVVGQAAPGDPPGLASASGPALLMPAVPKAGDAWRPEDVPPHLEKTARALTTTAAVRTAGARHAGCLRVVEVDVADGGARELRTYAPGIGLVATRERGERLTLQASTIRRAGAR